MKLEEIYMPLHSFSAKMRQTVTAADNSDEEEEPYCPCGRANDRDMVWCDGEMRCPYQWFHYQCVGLTEMTVPPGKWFCPGKYQFES